MAGKKRKEEKTSPEFFIKPEMVKNFIARKKNKELALLFSSFIVIIVLVFIYLQAGIFYPRIPTDEVVQQVAIRQGPIVAGQPVKWVMILNKEGVADNQKYLELPKGARDIAVTQQPNIEMALSSLKPVTLDLEQIAKFLEQMKIQQGNTEPLNKLTGFLAAAVERAGEQLFPSFGPIVNASEQKYLAIDKAEKEGYTVVEYYTDAPQITETATNYGLKVVVSAPSELGYADVSTFAKLGKEMSKIDLSKVSLLRSNKESGQAEKVAFKSHDTNGNGEADMIEWTVPHLSEQTYSIIYVSNALHYGSDNALIADIYEKVKNKDGIYSDPTKNGEYIEATFTAKIDRSRDITIYAKSSGQSRVGLYAGSLDKKIAEFENVSVDQKYKILLKPYLTEGEEYSTFFLKTIGDPVQYDQIIDPSMNIDRPPTPDDSSWLTTGSFTASISSIDCGSAAECNNACSCMWRLDGVNSDFGDCSSGSSSHEFTGLNDNGTGYSWDVVTQGQGYITEEPAHCENAEIYGGTSGTGVKVDTTNPTTNWDCQSCSPGETWMNVNPTITLSCDDGIDGSGCAWTKYCVGANNCDQTLNTYIEPFSAGEGDNWVRFQSEDSVGHTNDVQNYQMRIDETKPTTTPVIDSPVGYNPGTWTNQSVVVSTSCDDGSLSGCATTYYNVDWTGAPDWTQYGTPVTISDTGQHTFFTYSVDTATNQEICSDQNACSRINNIFIDKNPPTAMDVSTGAYTPGTWTTSATITINGCTDGEGEAGCDAGGREYKINSGTWTNYDLPFDINSSYPGQNTVYFRASDNVGNMSETLTSVAVWIDNVNPVITNPVNVYTKLYEFVHTINYSDAGVGIDTATCSFEGGYAFFDPPTTCTTTSSSVPVYVGSASHAEGTYPVSFSVSDTVPNQATANYNVVYDVTAPTVTPTAGVYTFNTWSTSNVTVTLSCSDALSGCVAINPITYCTTTGASCSPSTSYTTPFEISAEGTTKVYYYAVDKATNQSSTANQTIKIDKTNPSTTSNDVPASWQTGNFNITFVCSDATSGCAKTYYCTDSNDTCTADTNYAICSAGNCVLSWTTEGNYYLRYRSQDTATNFETTTSTAVNRVRLDKTNPTVNAGSDQSKITQFTQDATVSDVTSGVASYLWLRVSGPGTITFGTATAEDTTISADADGNYVIRLTVTDNAGNPNTDDFNLAWDANDPTNVGISSITADSSTQLTVLAQTATDTIGLSATPYWFREVSGRAGSSSSADWQEGTTFIDTGLSPNTQYSYGVKAIDSAGNESDYSASVLKYTLANVPSTLSLTANSKTQATATWEANSNSATTQYYIENTTNSTNSGWIADTSWASSGLTCETAYSFKVRAKNGDGVETNYTDPVSVTTSSCGSSGGSTVPTISAESVSIKINNGDASTQDPNVTLTITAGSDVTRMMIANDPSFAGGVEEPIQSEVKWILPGGNGDKTVYVNFFNSYGSARYISDTIYYGVTIQEVVTQIPSTVVETVTNLPETINNIPGQIINIIQGGSPQSELPPLPPAEEVVTEAPPLVMSQDWDVFTVEPFSQLTSSVLPSQLKELSDRVPQLSQEIKDAGIAKSTVVTDILNAQLTIPGLALVINPEVAAGQGGVAALQSGVPLDQLSAQTKTLIPSEIVFARTAGEKVDYNINVSVDSQGNTQQQIRTTVGVPLDLVIKPDKAVDSITGYIAFKSSDMAAAYDQYLVKQGLIPIAYAQTGGVENIPVVRQFAYADIDEDGIYTASLTMPEVAGEYDIATKIDYQDPKLKEKTVHLITVVDPDGYIYEQLPSGKMRISGVTVSLFWLNPLTKVYELWPAEDYQQTNPQVTNDSGAYSFLVPPGEYYLKAESDEYQSYQTTSFEVKAGSGVHQNIQLEKKFVWLRSFIWQNALVALSTVVIIFLLYGIFAIIRKRRKHSK